MRKIEEATAGEESRVTEATMPDTPGLSSSRHMSLEEAYSRYAPSAKRLAYLLSHDVHSAEDLTQDAFVRVAGHLHHLRSPDSFWAYLRTTLVHLALSRDRRAKLERAALPIGQARDDLSQSGAGQPDGIADRHLLLEAIGRLPAKQRVAVVLMYYEDMPVDEIAGHLGASPGTVRSWLSRALSELRTSVREAERPDE